MIILSLIIIYLSLLRIMKMHYENKLNVQEEKHEKEIEDINSHYAKFAQDINAMVTRMKAE